MIFNKLKNRIACAIEDVFDCYENREFSKDLSVGDVHYYCLEIEGEKFTVIIQKGNCFG